MLHGELIKGSGILEILNQLNFSTTGVSAVVDVNSIKRARYCVQVTVSALYNKLKEAADADGTTLPPYDWLRVKSKKNKSLYFWKVVFEFQLNILIFVRSIREGDFKVYVEVLRKFLKCYFIFDKVHYSRWLTVHVFDLLNLKTKHPDVYDNMIQGCFSFQKTSREFSRMALDQVHEQNNRVIKASNGAIHCMNRSDESALIRWETCGPDIARLITEFEDGMEFFSSNDVDMVMKHHEDNETFQRLFTDDVKTLCLGMPVNPFIGSQLVKLNDPSACIPDCVVTKLERMEKDGEKQVVTFINDRLLYQKFPICETIPRNNISLWTVEKLDKDHPFLPTPSVLSKMRSACDHRPEQSKEVFNHEIYGVAQSLSTDLKSMYLGNKGDICKRLNNFKEPKIPDSESKSALVIEMSPIIRAKGASIDDDCKTFFDFALLLYHYIMILGRPHNRIDLIFDRYFQYSLKTSTRAGRDAKNGNGTRMHFTDDTLLPRDMTDNFLKNSENKDDLGRYLAKRFIEIHNSSKLLIVTYEDTIISSAEIENMPSFTSIVQCQSEEADQRIVRHVIQCLKSSVYNRIIVRTIDTDVLIMLISFLADLVDGFKTEIHAELVNSAVFYHINTITKTLGKEVCAALLFFYAFTGCDIVSSFYGKGKVKAWDTWINNQKKDEFTAVFKSLGNCCCIITDEQMCLLEEFVEVLYGRKGPFYGGVGQLRLKPSLM